MGTLDFISSITRRHTFLTLFAAGLGMATSMGASACPIGGCVAEISNNVICSAQCLNDGYTVSVIQTVDGGPSLPSECNFTSPTGQYLIVEGTIQQQNYSNPNQQMASSVAQQVVSMQFVNPDANSVQCDVWGNELYQPFYTVTLSNIPQGVRACIPAREIDLDCGSASLMAQKYNGRRPNQGFPILPACRDDNCVGDHKGDGMDSGAADCHGGGLGSNPDNPNCEQIDDSHNTHFIIDCAEDDTECNGLHKQVPDGQVQVFERKGGMVFQGSSPADKPSQEPKKENGMVFHDRRPIPTTNQKAGVPAAKPVVGKAKQDARDPGTPMQQPSPNNSLSSPQQK